MVYIYINFSINEITKGEIVRKIRGIAFQNKINITENGEIYMKFVTFSCILITDKKLTSDYLNITYILFIQKVKYFMLNVQYKHVTIIYNY